MMQNWMSNRSLGETVLTQDKLQNVWLDFPSKWEGTNSSFYSYFLFQWGYNQILDRSKAFPSFFLE